MKLIINDEYVLHRLKRIENILFEFDEKIKEIEDFKKLFPSAVLYKYDIIQDIHRLVHKHEEYLHKISGMESFDADKLLSNQKILDDKIKELEKMLKEVNSSGKKPYKCPVCDSRGNNSQEVEPNIFKMTLCNPCQGKGIVWG